MILLETHSRFLLQILQNRVKSLEKPVELDYHFVEFDDVRYHIQATVKDPYHMVLSILIPTPPPETVFSGGLPFGATEAVKGAYGTTVQIVDTPEEGFQLTLKLDLAKLPSDEERRTQLMTKIASLRSVVLGAPMREILKHLAFKIVAPDADRLVALVHRPKESFFLIPQPEKVTVVFPMRFKDSVDVILATSFLQEFMEARRTAGLNNAPSCVWSTSPPLELKGAPAHALHANAGFVSFVIFPRHVVGKKLEKTVWSLLTFHSYVNYHIKIASSSASGRNWSTYCFIHSAKHNRLLSKRVENLVYVHSNLRLLSHNQRDYTQGETKMWDIEPEHTNLDAPASQLFALTLDDLDIEPTYSASGIGSSNVNVKEEEEEEDELDDPFDD